VLLSSDPANKSPVVPTGLQEDVSMMAEPDEVVENLGLRVDEAFFFVGEEAAPSLVEAADGRLLRSGFEHWA